MFHPSDESVAPTDFSSLSSYDHNIPAKTEHQKRLFFSLIRKLLMGNLCSSEQATQAALVPGLESEVTRLNGIIEGQKDAVEGQKDAVRDAKDAVRDANAANNRVVAAKDQTLRMANETLRMANGTIADQRAQLQAFFHIVNADKQQIEGNIGMTEEQQYSRNMERLLHAIFDIARQRVEATNKVPQLGSAHKETDKKHRSVICEYLMLSIAMSCFSVLEQENEESTPRAVLSNSSDIKGLAASWMVLFVPDPRAENATPSKETKKEFTGLLRYVRNRTKDKDLLLTDDSYMSVVSRESQKAICEVLLSSLVMTRDVKLEVRHSKLRAGPSTWPLFFPEDRQVRFLPQTIRMPSAPSGVVRDISYAAVVFEKVVLRPIPAEEADQEIVSQAKNKKQKGGKRK